MSNCLGSTRTQGGDSRRGLPKRLYVDNGQVFHAVQFGAAYASLNIKKLHSPPYQPEGRGKIERFFGTVREQFLPEVERVAASGAARIQTLHDLNAAFWAWLDQVYHARVHTETGQSPFERFTSGPVRVHPECPTLKHSGQAFLWCAKRTCHSTLRPSRFKATRILLIPPSPGRARLIELRFDPFDLSKLECIVRGQATRARHG